MSETHQIDGLTPSRLRAVLAVAATGSFSAAARDLGTSQSNVSRSVAAVESTLGIPVFDRSTRSVRLTDAGRDFVERASVVTVDLQAALAATRPDQPPVPRLAIATLASVSELHLTRALSSLPGGVPRFRCVEGLQADVELAVASGQASAGVGDLANVGPELVVEPLWSEPFRLAVPMSHRLARRRRVGIGEIASEALVGFPRTAGLRTTVDRELAAARRLRNPDFVVDRYGTALSLVAAGLALMIVPAIIAPSLPTGVRLVALDHPDMARTMGVLHRPENQPTAQFDEVVRQLVRVVAEIADVERIDQ